MALSVPGAWAADGGANAGASLAAGAAPSEATPDAGVPVGEATPVAGVGPVAVEAADGGPATATAIEELADLEALLDLPTVSSAKVEQRAAAAPAVVTVVTAEELALRGYASVADALRVVPGFYDVYDWVTHNVGVRGVSGGARAAGSVLKLMIDGHPVDFRPTTGNFFGEELIPLAAVDRLEIIRGPASALYGANAYLGVVNVITKKGADVSGARALARGQLVQGHPGGGAGLLVGAAGGGWDVLLAADFLWADRSGLEAPPSSPTDFSARGKSSSDFARTKSLFGKAAVDGVLGGRLTLSASVQSLEARAEFQDFVPLTHRTRLGWLNQNFRAAWDASLGERVGVTASAHYFAAQPAPDERIDVGRSDYALLRSVGADGFGVSAEARVAAADWLRFTAGADLVSETHQKQTFAQLLTEDVLTPGGTVVRSAGTVVPGVGYGETARFLNIGAFLQGMASVGDAFHGIAGLRLDEHSLYRTNVSGRVGLVYAPPARPLSVKVLYGTSFKAPSAVQLYTQPMAARDVLGNPDLRAQTAQTGELAALLGLPRGFGEVSASVFVTLVRGMVEFQQAGLYLQARNLMDEAVLGAELESRLRLGDHLRLRLSGGVARAVAVYPRAGAAAGDAPVNPLFPAVQLHAVAEYRTPFARALVVSAEVSWVSPRAASQSNALIAGRPYAVEGYVYTAAALAWSGTVAAGRTTAVSLRVSNPFGLAWADPGFGGIDVPGRGALVTVNLTQGL